MSIFVRPESPPPRQPSPDITPAPLPYPHHHPRRVVSQPKIRAYSPSRPPGLQLPTRSLQPVRSYDHMTTARSDRNSLMILRNRTFPSSRTQQPSRSGPELNSRHRFMLTPRSPVHVCPVANSPFPPVLAASSSKRTLKPQPISFDSLYLPHIDEMGASTLIQRKHSKPVFPPLQKHKSLGMACLHFFRFRNS